MSALRIIRAADYDDMSKKAANIIFSQITLKPDSVLGLATGSTPIGAYKKLIEWYQSGDLDFSRIHSVNLDEYCGLAPEHEQSYRFFMETNLFQHVNIKPENTNVPNGLAEDVQAECARYEKDVYKRQLKDQGKTILLFLSSRSILSGKCSPGRGK